MKNNKVKRNKSQFFDKMRNKLGDNFLQLMTPVDIERNHKALIRDFMFGNITIDNLKLMIECPNFLYNFITVLESELKKYQFVVSACDNYIMLNRGFNDKISYVAYFKSLSDLYLKMFVYVNSLLIYSTRAPYGYKYQSLDDVMDSLKQHKGVL